MDSLFDWLEAWSIGITLWLQDQRSDALGSLFYLISSTGEELFFLLLLPLMYWCVSPFLARRMTVVFLLSVWSNFWLKEWWQRPRPGAFSSAVIPLQDAPDFGVPSGHAQGTAVWWGALGLHLRRWQVWLIIAAYVLLICLSRLMLGVHFFHDVAAGLLLGLLWLAAYAYAEPRVSAWLAAQSGREQFRILAALCALLVVIHPLLVQAVWVTGSRRAMVPVGLLFGIGSGWILDRGGLHFAVAGPWWQRALRFLAGVFGLIVIYFGLETIFGEIDLALPAAGLGPLFYFLRYAAIGWWIGYGGPRVFIKLGLAGRMEKAPAESHADGQPGLAA